MILDLIRFKSKSQYLGTQSRGLHSNWYIKN